jgi:hypothetical protein
MKITTKFDLKDRVYIPELKTNGVVLGFFVDDLTCVKYQIRYFKDNNPVTTYFMDFELEKYKEEAKAIGFGVK